MIPGQHHRFWVNESTPPNLTTVTPIDNFMSQTTNTIIFTYIPQDDHTITNCSLYTNHTGVWQIKKTNTGIDIGENNTITGYNLLNVSMVWNVKCTDDTNQEAWGINKTLFINMSRPIYQSWYWRDQYGGGVMELDAGGYLTLSLAASQLTVTGNIYATGEIEGSYKGSGDLKLIGFSDDELLISPTYKQNNNKQGLATINIYGNYNGSTDNIYLIKINIDGGTEVGQATYNWSDDGTYNWDKTNQITSTTLTDLNDGVKIGFVTQDGQDFYHGDEFIFTAYSDPDEVLRIDTNVSGSDPWIHSMANWNLTGVNFWFTGLMNLVNLNITGDICNQTNCYSFENFLNNTDSDTDTHISLVYPYLYDNNTHGFFNATHNNQTIIDLDTNDTLKVNEIYPIVISDPWVNITENVNVTIDANLSIKTLLIYENSSHIVFHTRGKGWCIGNCSE